MKNKIFLSIICFFLSLIFFIFEQIKVSDSVLVLFYSIAYLFNSIVFFVNCDKNMLDIRFLFYIFFTLFIGVSPVFYYIYNKTLYLYQFNVILIFSLIYIFISSIYKTNKKMILIKKYTKDNKKIVFKNYEFFAKSLLILSLIANIIFFIKNKNVLFSGNLENGRIAALSGNGLILQIMNFSNIGICILFELFLEKKYKLSKLILILMVFMPLTLLRGFRSSILALIIVFMLMYNKKYGLKINKIIRYGIIMIILVGGLQVIRSNMSGGNMKFIDSLVIALKNGSINLNYVFQRFGRNIPFQHGYSYLVNIKMLMPGPDLDFTLWLKELMGISFNGGGITPTLIGEFYLNFGYLGVYIGAIITALIVVKVNENYKNSNLVYFSSYLGYQCAASVGSGFANIEIGLLFTSVVYLIILKLCLKDSVEINEK